VRIVALLLVLSACVKPVPVNLQAAHPDLHAFGGPRPCTLNVQPVEDRRPEVERSGGEGGKPRFKYFVPALLWWQWAMAGPRVGQPELYAVDFLPDLNAVMKATMERSGVCAGGGPVASLKTSLRHYVGLSYQKVEQIVSYGAAAAVSYDFFPVAHVAMDFELATADGIVERFTLDGRYLFNPTDPGMSTKQPGVPGGTLPPAVSRQLAPRVALERMLAQLPDRVDRALAGLGGAEAPAANDTFLVARLTREYDFVEEMVVETDTGRIVTDRVVRRRLPVLGAPDEWVVVPVDGNGRWLTNEGYATLVNRLRRNYQVEFDGNVSAAKFGGWKG
jgi:hypothetical protein